MPSLIPHAIPRRYADPVAKVIARTGMTPDMITAGGLALNVLAGAAIATGNFAAGGGLILAGGALDLLDGAVARATGESSLFGSVFDATADRYAEAANLFGLLAYYVAQGDRVQPLLLFAAITGSIQTSYVKARVEAIGQQLNEGIFTRSERVLLLAGALLLAGRPGWGWVLPATVWLLAVMTNLTAVQRLYHAWQKLRGQLGAEVPH
ncbi:MAG TPA: CDP-alcohol phosphatidyltransferase family protein [Dehalococcoidia bacterium]|nr:CDP-alcohol phosphatidyltransferase family protein [Dehalococcoidia bacterium]